MCEQLDPHTKAQWVRSYGLQISHYVLISVDVALCVSLELCSLHFVALQYYTGEDAMRVDCGSWIRWLSSRARSCADTLLIGDRWERDESTANG